MRQTDKTTQTASATPDKVREEWRHPITGETRAEMHAKRTKVTPQVKAIDGMTPLGMTHVNTGKPAGIRETQNEQDNREARTIPAEKPTAQDDDGKISRSDWRELALSRYERMEHYRTHAEALAEAYKELCDLIMAIPHGIDPRIRQLARDRQALTAYKEGK